MRPPPAVVADIEPVLLVVDDDPDVRRLTQSLLTAHGYHVIVAAHGGTPFTDCANGVRT